MQLENISKKVLFSALLLLVYVFTSFASENIQSIVLEDFELGDDGNPKRYWALVPNRFGREGSVDGGKSLQQMRWVKAWPEAYFGNEVDGAERGEFFYGPVDTETAKQRYTDVSGHCLGMSVLFNRMGYNLVELYPLEQNDEGKYERSPLAFKGRIKEIDFWVWGANYNYFMELVLRDYRGVDHRLDVGSIKHIGWKNFKVNIPNYIPQSVTYIPSTKRLSLVKFAIWTHPDERVSGAYIYLDHIKYLANVFEELYDGYKLGDPEYVNELFEGAAEPPSEEEILP